MEVNYESYSARKSITFNNSASFNGQSPVKKNFNTQQASQMGKSQKILPNSPTSGGVIPVIITDLLKVPEREEKYSIDTFHFNTVLF